MIEYKAVTNSGNSGGAPVVAERIGAQQLVSAA